VGHLIYTDQLGNKTASGNFSARLCGRLDCTDPSVKFKLSNGRELRLQMLNLLAGLRRLGALDGLPRFGGVARSTAWWRAAYW
jgi:hypothetical protein